MTDVANVTSLLDNAEVGELEGTPVLLLAGSPLQAFPFEALVAILGEGDAAILKMKSILTAIETELTTRMIEEGEVDHFDPSNTITYKSPGNEDHKVDEPALYQDLYDLVEAKKVDPDLVKKAIDAEPQIVYSHHMTYIEMLRKKGGEVARVIEKHVVRGEPKPPKIKIVPKIKQAKRVWKIPAPRDVRMPRGTDGV